MVQAFRMLVIGIAGGSGSGKTTFVKKVLSRIPATDEVGIMHQDSYYHSVPKARKEASFNFDHPDAFDWKLFKEHLDRATEGKAVSTPTYDYSQSKRAPQTQILGPCKALLVEGIFVLWDPEVRKKFNIKMYLHVEADIRFIRRLHRDVKERHRSIDGIIQQYYDTVRPMHHEFLEPTRQFADIIVGEETDIAADILAARIWRYLQVTPC